ncbi:hypothetical protein ACFY2Q_28750 [Micromonospora sp. NPDC000316]|uniref:hypothetical protein n=1 Tax=Micromonospora sp. NPDC000316 TaxID=3364216 RepID=UPI0036944AE9
MVADQRRCGEVRPVHSGESDLAVPVRDIGSFVEPNVGPNHALGLDGCLAELAVVVPTHEPYWLGEGPASQAQANLILADRAECG